VLDDGEMREIEIQAQDFPCFLGVKLGDLPCLLGRLRAGVAVGFQIQRQSQVGGLFLHRDPQVHGLLGLRGVVAKLHIDSDRVHGSEIPQRLGIIRCMGLATSEKGEVVFFTQILQLGKGARLEPVETGFFERSDLLLHRPLAGR
jgi:hypothetical protein